MNEQCLVTRFFDIQGELGFKGGNGGGGPKGNRGRAVIIFLSLLFYSFYENLKKT